MNAFCGIAQIIVQLLLLTPGRFPEKDLVSSCDIRNLPLQNLPGETHSSSAPESLPLCKREQVVTLCFITSF